MKVTITSLTLKSPFKFFALASYAMNIMKQLKSTNCVDMKKTGVWTKHYTMSLWQSEDDLKTFSGSGAHLEAMKKGRKIASEIATLTIDAENLPTWKEAKQRLASEGKTISYS